MPRHAPLDDWVTRLGPETVEEAGEWPAHVCAKVLERGLGDRALTLLSQGALCYSDYSGIDLTREAIRIIVPALSEAVGQPRPPDVRHVRASDKGEAQQLVLSRQAQRSNSGGCVFGDLTTRVAPNAEKWIAQVLEANDGAVSNKNIHVFLKDNGAWAYRFASYCHCLAHKQQCPLYPGVYTKFPHPDEDDDSCSPTPPRKTARKAQQSFSSSAHGTPWWKPLLPFGGRPLVISCAGLTCTDFSPLGHQKRGSGKEDHVHSIWREERRQLALAKAEDVFLTECSPRYPPDVMQGKHLQDTHTVIHIVFGPEDWGYPARRRRSYSVGLNNATMVWVGPSEATAVQKEFDMMFKRTCEMTGDDLLLASNADVSSWVKERSLRRQTLLPSNHAELPMSEYMETLVSPSCMLNHRVNDQLRAEQCDSLNGAFLCDLEQSAHRGTTPGPLVPALSTHSLIYSFKKQRLAIPSEWFGIQGIDSHSRLWGSRGQSPVVQSTVGVAENTLRGLLGNALYVPVFAAWFLFAMGNCVRRETPMIPASLTRDDWLDDGAAEVSEEGIEDLAQLLEEGLVEVLEDDNEAPTEVLE